ncbi:MAG: hypothetical protein ACE5HI_08625 [bacterium]
MKRQIFFLVLIFSFCFLSNHLISQTNHTKYPGNPVLEPGPAAWDGVGVSGATVLFDGSIFQMWYTGYHPDVEEIGYATSTNGINWIKYSGNPIVDINGIPGSFDEQVASAPSVIWDGSQYVMYYSGHDNRGCGVAYSMDGIHWTKSNANPILIPGAPDEWDRYVGGTTVLFRDNTYMVWYNGADGVTGGIDYAEGPVDQPPTPLETSDIQIEWHPATVFTLRFWTMKYFLLVYTHTIPQPTPLVLNRHYNVVNLFFQTNPQWLMLGLTRLSNAPLLKVPKSPSMEQLPVIQTAIR